MLKEVSSYTPKRVLLIYDSTCQRELLRMEAIQIKAQTPHLGNSKKKSRKVIIWNILLTQILNYLMIFLLMPKCKCDLVKFRISDLFYYFLVAIPSLCRIVTGNTSAAFPGQVPQGKNRIRASSGIQLHCHIFRSSSQVSFMYVRKRWEWLVIFLNKLMHSNICRLNIAYRTVSLQNFNSHIAFFFCLLLFSINNSCEKQINIQ